MAKSRTEPKKAQVEPVTSWNERKIEEKNKKGKKKLLAQVKPETFIAQM